MSRRARIPVWESTSGEPCVARNGGEIVEGRVGRVRHVEQHAIGHGALRDGAPGGGEASRARTMVGLLARAAERVAAAMHDAEQARPLRGKRVEGFGEIGKPIGPLERVDDRHGATGARQLRLHLGADGRVVESHGERIAVRGVRHEERDDEGLDAAAAKPVGVEGERRVGERLVPLVNGCAEIGVEIDDLERARGSGRAGSAGTRRQHQQDEREGERAPHSGS